MNSNQPVDKLDPSNFCTFDYTDVEMPAVKLEKEQAEEVPMPLLTA